MASPPRSSLHAATRYAAALAGAYVVVAGLYILLSTHLAAALASSLQDLEVLERIKGIAFVLVTGAALFVLARTLFGRWLRSSEEVARAREAIMRADRHALPGLLASSIAHDFKNVLTVIGASAELLEADPPPDERATLVADLRKATEHASALARELSRAGRSSAAGPVRDVDVTAVVQEAVALLHHHPLARTRSIACELAEGLHGEVYPTLVQQIVSNLVVNALDAVPEHGRVLVRASKEGDAIRLEVHDSGPGVPADVAARIFDPFYTTKANGTGLGLVSTRTCAQLHGGDVVLSRSETLGGAAFVVTLRAARKDPTLA
jgi:signal transduction histidine kinase